MLNMMFVVRPFTFFAVEWDDGRNLSDQEEGRQEINEVPANI